MTTTKEESKLINGVRVDELFATMDAMNETPAMGKTQIRITNKWVKAGHNHTVIKDFYAAQEERVHEKTFELDADEPVLLLGDDIGPNPVEYLLKGLAGCLTTSMVYHAAAKGIEIRGVESRLEGNLDLRGFLGVDPEVKTGCDDIRVYYTIDADISDEQKEELIQLGQKYSPVFSTISNATRVSVQLDK
jgi:uncharacterized OsmC-like protein